MTSSKLLEHLQLLMSNREERLRSQFDEWYWVMRIFKNLRTWSRKGTIQEWWHVAIRGRSWNNHDTGASRARRQCKHSFSTSSRRSEGERRKKGCQQQTGETHRWLTYNMSPGRRTNGTVLQMPTRQRAEPKAEEMNMGSDVDGVSSSGRLSARGDVETKENDELNRPLLQTISCSDLVCNGLWKQQCKKTYWARE